MIEVIEAVWLNQAYTTVQAISTFKLGFYNILVDLYTVYASNQTNSIKNLGNFQRKNDCMYFCVYNFEKKTPSDLKPLYLKNLEFHLCDFLNTFSRLLVARKYTPAAFVMMKKKIIL